MGVYIFVIGFSLRVLLCTGMIVYFSIVATAMSFHLYRSASAYMHPCNDKGKLFKNDYEELPA